jgi:hypothetical protein
MFLDVVVIGLATSDKASLHVNNPTGETIPSLSLSHARPIKVGVCTDKRNSIIKLEIALPDDILSAGDPRKWLLLSLLCNFASVSLPHAGSQKIGSGANGEGFTQMLCGRMSTPSGLIQSSKPSLDWCNYDADAIVAPCSSRPLILFLPSSTSRL